MDARLRDYRALLREHPDYRRLWVGQVISQGGDWFNQIAVMILLQQMGGSPLALATTLVLRMLPAFVLAPLAGVLIDRIDRRKILIVSDLLRAATVPLFLLADEPDEAPWVLALVALQVVFGAFFEPAKTALVPSLVPASRLFTANALSSMTWSVMLSIGAAVAAPVIDQFGLRVAFVVDAVSYVLSAVAIARIRARAEPVPRTGPRHWVGGLYDLRDGLRYVRGSGAVLSLVLVKAGVALAGGIVLLLYVFGAQVFPSGERNALSIGALFVARGIGGALGPYVGRAFTGRSEPAMRRAIGWGFLQAALFFVLFSQAESLLMACILLVIAHLGTSIAWVFSTLLLQLRVPDRFRGRTFSTEWAFFTVSFCTVNYGCGLALDDLGWNPRAVAAVSGTLLLVPGLLWTAAHVVRGRRELPADG